MSDKWPVEIDKPLLQKLLERSEQRDFLEVAAECDIAIVVEGFDHPFVSDNDDLRDKLKSHEIREAGDNPLRQALGYAVENKAAIVMVIDAVGEPPESVWFFKFGWHLGFSHAVTLSDAIDMERQLEKRKKELAEKK